MSTVRERYRACTAGPFRGELTAQRVSLYPRSPFTIYCEKFAPASRRDPLGPYRRLLQERGVAHENAVVENRHPGYRRLPCAEPLEGFRMLLDEMARGAEAICGLPLLYLPENLQGRPDLLEKTTGHPSIFGDYAYVVKEIKVSKNIREHHILQGAFYNYLLSKLQQYLPERFFIINGDSEQIAFEYRRHEASLERALRGTQAILDGLEVPTPTYNAGEWPWQTYTNAAALKSRDISLAGQVGPKMKDKLAERGFRKIWDLSPSRLEELKKIPRVGEATALRLVRSAQAIVKKKVIEVDLSALRFPERSCEIFLDLEGADPPGDEGDFLQVDYLIGVLIRRDACEEYRPFMAWHPREEGDMFRRFMEFLQGQPDGWIYHWHNYERWHMRQLAERYGMTAEAESILFPRMVDLHRTATAAFVFPTPTNGLKDVAAYLGYRWRREDVNALDAIAYYLLYQEDPEGYRSKMQEVIDYNEDDCRATLAVKDWLQSKVSPVAGAVPGPPP